MFEKIHSSQVKQERALLVGVYGPDTARLQAEDYINELALLARTAGGTIIDKMLQNRTQPDSSTFVGEGKLREISGKVHDEKIDVLIFDDDLSPTQLRNIEQEAQIKVMDRSGLILDIFASRAKTAAAKTQVELAQLEYLRPRLTRFWSHLSRQQGGIGMRGPGESQIETDRRLIDKRISTLTDKLNTLDKQRKTQRKGRSNMTRISLVGYTNAGKSTLMNALTKADLLAEDQLFATLDSTIRRITIDQYDVLLSDTVGFIRKLPYNLIESFKSTLDEVREADILLHVVDASATLFREHIKVVNETLQELDIAEKKVLKVFNKIDALAGHQLQALKNAYPQSAYISAERGIGLSKLREQIQQLIEKDFITKTMHIPLSKYESVAFLHRVAHIHSLNYQQSQANVTFSISKDNFLRLKNMLPNLDEETVVEP